jgi:hypothetical protein
MLTILHFLASHITFLQFFLTDHPGPDFEPPDPPRSPKFKHCTEFRSQGSIFRRFKAFSITSLLPW